MVEYQIEDQMDCQPIDNNIKKEMNYLLCSLPVLYESVEPLGFAGERAIIFIVLLVTLIENMVNEIK